MKYALILPLFVMSITIYAMPCPNGGGILYKGDTLADVIQQCGEPTKKNIKRQIISSVKVWTYYIEFNRQYVFSRNLVQLMIFFTMDKVTRININERYWLPSCRQTVTQGGGFTSIQTTCGTWAYDVTSTNLCGGTVFGLGDSIDTVHALCGNPSTQSDQTVAKEHAELLYDGSNPQTLILEDGKLTDWK